jgi:hypothetical protein
MLILDGVVGLPYIQALKNAEEKPMKKFVPLVIFVMFAGILSPSSLSAQEPKRGRITIAVFGGGLSGVGFLSGYAASAGVVGGIPGGGNLLPEYDPETEGPRLNLLSAGAFGFSLGYSLGMGSRPIRGLYPLSIYAEIIYCPTVKFGDGIEKRSWFEWDQAQFKFVEKSDTFTQTDRKAGMTGVTFGAMAMPLRNLPLGLGMGIGWCRFSQSFTSGTLRFLEGKTDLTNITATAANTGLSSAGGGRLERNHSALLFKIGLTYRILPSLSLDASFRTASYFDTHDTNLIYVESGEGVKMTEGHRLGNLFSGGITYFF